MPHPDLKELELQEHKQLQSWKTMGDVHRTCGFCGRKSESKQCGKEHGDLTFCPLAKHTRKAEAEKASDAELLYNEFSLTQELETINVN